MKPVGALMVMLGGVAVFFVFSSAQRRQLAYIRDLAAALTQLAGEIRWKLLPLPEAIRHLCDRKLTGTLFREIHNSLESGSTLQYAWIGAVQNFPGEVRDILLPMEWGGDIKQQEESVLYVARQMRELGEKRASALRQREKLCAAAALSATGLLVLILV